MVEFILHILVTSVLLLFIAEVLDGIQVDRWSSAFFTAFILGICNALLKPLLIFLTLPVTVLTLGLFLLVINGFMLYFAASFIDGFKVRDFGTAFIASILLSVLNWLLSLIF